MSIELQKIGALIKNKKYKKALLSLKKMPSSIYGVELYKGVCHSGLKQYPQALIHFKAAQKTIPENKKTTLLNDMAMAALLMKENEQAIEYYMDSLKLDSTANNAFAREQLVSLLVNNQQYDLALSYITQLFALQNFAVKAYITGVKIAVATGSNDLLKQYLVKIKLQKTDFSHEQLAEVLNTLIKKQQTGEFNDLLGELNNTFKEAAWLDSFNSYASDLNKKAKPKIKKLPKKQITGRDKKLIGLITELVEHNKQQGAYFHPDLEIKANNGELSVYYYGQKNTKLIDIPVACMPLLCDYEFTLTGNDKLVVKSNSNHMVNPKAEYTMQLLVSIYNQSNKMQKWQVACPFIALYDSPDLLNALLDAKLHNVKVQLLKQTLVSGNRKKLCIDTFFGSRAFGYKSDFLNKNKITSGKNREQGLLSVIDFLNHKLNSNSFKLTNNSVHITGSADAQSNEVFVQYNEFDPLYTYLFYGFVDIEAPFLASIPCELATTYGHVLQITGESTIGNTLSEGKFNHNQAYLPQLVRVSTNKVKLNKLIMPVNALSTLLKDTLLNVINTTAPDEIVKNDTFFKSEIAHLEKQLILANKAYWLKLQRMANEEKNIPEANLIQLHELINFSTSLINNYANKNAIALF
jgi:tetratricopeptide (TPR) repeat protein